MTAAVFTAELAACTGLDDPRWRAVELLAGAWQPALASAQRLGYETGYAAGYWQAEREMFEVWHRVAVDVIAFREEADLTAKYRRESGVA